VRGQRDGLVASSDGWSISGSVRLTLPPASATAAHFAERPLTLKGTRQVPEIWEPRGRSLSKRTLPRAKTRAPLGRCAWPGTGSTKDLRRHHPPSIESNVMRARSISNPTPQSPNCPDMDAQDVGIFTKPRCSQG
jgi:hypothetical protein